MIGHSLKSEALEGAVPWHNSPQVCPYGLYAEQISGTAFTVPRTHNQRVWVYRIRPQVVHHPFEFIREFHPEAKDCISTPNQLRWDPLDIEKGHFVDGIKSMCIGGDPSSKSGMAIHIYTCTVSMDNAALQNSDGDFLIVPQQGVLDIVTELGKLRVEPLEICVIPRGIRFQVNVAGPSRGYICEVYNGHFELPDLGPIGSNGLADPKDFVYPEASYVHDKSDKPNFTIFNKYQHNLYKAIGFTPFDVVGWQGNYAPCKYDLRKFNTMNTVTWDHPDPSIYTVLTCKTNTPGVAMCDFVIFPPRWSCTEHTFKPPYFHRNCMTEYMGLISGQYEAKASGFNPGGGSLHSMFTPHGPDAATFVKASNAELKPERVAENTMAFMFETSVILSPTPYAMKTSQKLQPEYYKVWQDLKPYFDPNNKTPRIN